MHLLGFQTFDVTLRNNGCRKGGYTLKMELQTKVEKDETWRNHRTEDTSINQALLTPNLLTTQQNIINVCLAMDVTDVFKYTCTRYYMSMHIF